MNTTSMEGVPDVGAAPAGEVSVSQHRADLTALVAPLIGTTTVMLGEATGRVTSCDVLAPLDLPPFDNSHEDGYAVRLASLPAPGADGMIEVPAGPLIAAGDEPGALEPGTARPIMTGAPVPDGADAVLRAADSESGVFSPRGDVVRLRADRLPAAEDAGRYIRATGSDVRCGSVIVPAGRRLTAARCGVLAASGITQVEVRALPRTLVLSTGSELTSPGEPLQRGRIYDANGASIASALTEIGVPVVDQLYVPDEPGIISQLLATFADRIDLLVTSGGVSRGMVDVMRQAGQDAEMTFRTVAMQPGGPQGLGYATAKRQIPGFTLTDVPEAKEHKIPWAALPGNPVSALLSVELFLRPALLGFETDRPPRPDVRLPIWEGEAPQESPADKHQVRRARLRLDGTIEFVGGESSHLLTSYAGSNCLVHVPKGTDRVAAGDIVEVWILA